MSYQFDSVEDLDGFWSSIASPFKKVYEGAKSVVGAVESAFDAGLKAVGIGKIPFVGKVLNPLKMQRYVNESLINNPTATLKLTAGAALTLTGNPALGGPLIASGGTPIAKEIVGKVGLPKETVTIVEPLVKAAAEGKIDINKSFSSADLKSLAKQVDMSPAELKKKLKGAVGVATKEISAQAEKVKADIVSGDPKKLADIRKGLGDVPVPGGPAGKIITKTMNATGKLTTPQVDKLIADVQKSAKKSTKPPPAKGKVRKPGAVLVDKKVVQAGMMGGFSAWMLLPLAAYGVYRVATRSQSR